MILRKIAYSPVHKRYGFIVVTVTTVTISLAETSARSKAYKGCFGLISDFQKKQYT